MKLSVFIKRLILSLSFVSTFISAAQITSAQIEQFKQLSPSQQQALAKSMGVDLSSLNISGNTSSKPISPSLTELVPAREINKEQNNAVRENKANTELLESSETVKQSEESQELQFITSEETNALKPFGYSLFAGEPSTFAPVSDVPIPAEYILGPGDTLSVQLYGKETVSFNLTINRQGNIELPKLGPVNISGQSFTQARALIKDIVSERKIGVKANISMEELRSIRVFVLGEAYRAASYTLSSLSTVTQALYAAGGVNNIGSLRNIQVKRSGNVIAELDLYQLLLKGDTSQDINLMAGDVVFIPTVGETVGIKGEVNRPAIYELKNEKTVHDVIKLAGGVRATAYQQNGKILRINQTGLRTVISLNLTSNSHEKVQNGDTVSISSVLSTLEQSITVKGHVQRPGVYGWHKNIKISDILKNINDFKNLPDLEYILISRKNPITGKLTTFNINFSDYIENNNKDADFTLNANDTVYVFNKSNNRSKSLAPLLSTLKSQIDTGQLPSTVSIKGEVRAPGEYPLTENATVQDLLRAAMGQTEYSEIEFAILARKDKQLDTSVMYLDLTSTFDKNFPLLELDRLFLFHREKPRTQLLEKLISELLQQADKSNAQNVVRISGDVHFPGQYPYVVNMSSHDLIKLAGGLNESSYSKNADLIRFSHDGVETAEIHHENIELSSPFLLKSLDTLNIKRIPDWRERRVVKLFGEVQFPGTYTLQKGETLSNVIERAGGLTIEADANAAVFTRLALKEQEEKKLAQLQNQLANETAQITLTNDESNMSSDLAENTALLKKLNDTKAIGRLVLDLPKILTTSGNYDIRLDDGDALYIPKVKESITVIGEVQYGTSHVHNADFTLDDYVERSGGLKNRADKERIYVIKADGSVRLASNSNWFSAGEELLAAGDTIVIPLDLEYKDNLSLWTAVTQIIYNSAVAVAAIGSL